MNAHRLLVVLVVFSSPCCIAAQDGTPNADLSLPLGPLKLTLSPQGASLLGNVNADMWHPAWAKTKCGDHPDEQMTCGDLFFASTFNTDSSFATTSSDSAKNHASISFSPTGYFDLRNKTAGLSEDNFLKSLTKAQRAARDKYENDCATAKQAAIDAASIINPKLSDSDKIKIRAHTGNTDSSCIQFQDIERSHLPTYTDIISLSFSPDVQYRYGHFDISGTNYSADQLVAGASAHLFLPTLESLIPGPQLFVNWPYVSAGYYIVKNFHSSNIPPSPDVQDHYLDIEEHAAVYIPYFEKITGIKAIAQADLTESLPTSGANAGGWQVSRTYQLSFQTKGTWNFQPGITYQSGKDKGFTYDKQVLLGVLLPLF